MYTRERRKKRNINNGNNCDIKTVSASSWSSSTHFLALIPRVAVATFAVLRD